MRLTVLFVVAAADPARRALGKRKQGAKALPAFHAIPISALNFCSYDGVLRGPFAFRLSADELKHTSSVRSTA